MKTDASTCPVCQQSPGLRGLLGACRDCSKIVRELNDSFNRGGAEAAVSIALRLLDARSVFLRDDLPSIAWQSVGNEDPTTVLRLTLKSMQRVANRQRYLIRFVERFRETTATRRVPA